MKKEPLQEPSSVNTRTCAGGHVLTGIGFDVCPECESPWKSREGEEKCGTCKYQSMYTVCSCEGRLHPTVQRSGFELDKCDFDCKCACGSLYSHTHECQSLNYKYAQPRVSKFPQPPKDWEKEFDERYVKLVANAYPDYRESHNVILADIKSFIRTLLEKTREEAERRLEKVRKELKTIE